VKVSIYREGGGESRPRDSIQEALVHATRHCGNKYEKGKRSFQILAKLSPGTLCAHLPSFVRATQILNDKL